MRTWFSSMQARGRHHYQYQVVVRAHARDPPCSPVAGWWRQHNTPLTCCTTRGWQSLHSILCGSRGSLCTAGDAVPRQSPHPLPPAHEIGSPSRDWLSLPPRDPLLPEGFSRLLVIGPERMSGGTSAELPPCRVGLRANGREPREVSRVQQGGEVWQRVRHAQGEMVSAHPQ